VYICICICIYIYVVVLVVLFQSMIEVGYVTHIIYVYTERERERACDAHAHTSRLVTPAKSWLSLGPVHVSSDQAGQAGRLPCCVLQCAAVCCSHHCLHSYPRLCSQQAPLQVRVHKSESQTISLCVSKSYPCVCLNHIPVWVCVCLCVSRSYPCVID
jgi:hypothetical protein